MKKVAFNLLEDYGMPSFAMKFVKLISGLNSLDGPDFDEVQETLKYYPDESKKKFRYNSKVFEWNPMMKAE